MKKVNWLDHLINLIVLITGISVAFTLNAWNEEIKIEQLQATYIQSMGNDLNIDISELDSAIKMERQNLAIFHRIMNAVKKPMTVDSVALAISKIASIYTFDSRNITYESIKSSGKFELLDLGLRIDIIEFYHTGYDQIEEIEGYYKSNFDNQIIPFLLQIAYGEENPSNEHSSLDYTVLTNEKFRTILALHISFLVQKIQAYEHGHQLALKLHEKLKNNL